MALSPVYWLPEGSLGDARRFILSGDSHGLGGIIDEATEVPNPNDVAIPLIGEIMGWTGVAGLKLEFGRVGNFMAGVVPAESIAEWQQALTDLLADWPEGSLPRELNEYLILYADEADVAKQAIEYLLTALELPSGTCGLLMLYR